MRILLLGAGGQLAGDLQTVFSQEQLFAVSHAELDICDGPAVEAKAQEHRPELILNTAAYHRVDECEDQVEKTFSVNAAGIHHLARAANEVGAALVHFSTDYVFDGKKGTAYTESDPPNPQSIYALSKLAGEIIVRRYAQKYFLIRTCGLYGRASASAKGGRGNFVETMLRLAREGREIRVVSDQVLTPTSTRDLAQKLLPLLRSDRYGLYHMTNTGHCSWFEFAQEIFRLAGVRPQLQPTTSAAFGAKATRPSYSVLDNLAYREAGFTDFRPWQEALGDYLKTGAE